jgi:hypothetical protein
MILYLNSDKGEFSLNKKDYLLRAAQRLGIDYVKDMRLAEGEIEYLLNIQPCDLKTGSKWTGLWHIDVQLNNSLIHSYNNFDTVFIASTAGIIPPTQTLLFQAMDPLLHRRIPEVDQEYDFSICGTNSGDGGYTERTRIYELLKTKYTCNNGGGKLPPEEYVRQYNRGRVQVVQSFVTQGVEGYKTMCAQRFFECLGIGPVLCCYSDDLKYLGLTNEKDYFVYHNDKELFNYMDKLLKNKELRWETFVKGRAKALKLHTYENRLVTILNIIHDKFGFIPPQR